MGVTIHFEGRLKDGSAYEACIESAERFCAAHGWTCTPINETHTKLSRTHDEKDIEYVGPSSGLEIRPHTNSEPFRLEFDRDLVIQEYTKTQFAPIEIHVLLVELLHHLNYFFESLQVEDEGEYFETGDQSLLGVHRDSCSRMLNEYLAGPGKCSGPIHLPSGRIVDLVEYG